MNAPRSWWIDASGSLYDRPVAGADPLPGRFILPGSAGGMTLEIPPGPGTPMLPATGRFPGSRGPLLSRPARRPGGRVRAHQLCASRNRPGAAWVKVIADFPDLAAGTDAEATYQIGAIADFVAAVYAAGGGVAVHSTIAGAGPLVTAGSTRSTIVTGWMRAPSSGWRAAEWGGHQPSVALPALLDAPDMSRQRHRTLQDGRARLAEVLPVATRLGVPVLAGTDVTGSIPARWRC